MYRFCLMKGHGSTTRLPSIIHPSKPRVTTPTSPFPFKLVPKKTWIAIRPKSQLNITHFFPTRYKILPISSLSLSLSTAFLFLLQCSGSTLFFLVHTHTHYPSLSRLLFCGILSFNSIIPWILSFEQYI